MNWAPFGATPFGGAETMLAPPAAAVVEPPPEPPPQAADPVTAVSDVMAVDTVLAGSFGREAFGEGGWLLSEGDETTGVPRPYVVIGLDSLAAPVPVDRGGRATQDLAIRFEIYADDRDQASLLAQEVLDLFGTGNSPKLTWDGARELSRRPGRGDLANPPVKLGTAGNQIWIQSFLIEWTAQVRVKPRRATTT